MPTLQVDIAHDCEPSHLQVAQDYAKTYNLTVQLLQEYGPAGGNPLYEFTGARSDLISFIKDFYQDIDLDYHTSHIQD